MKQSFFALLAAITLLAGNAFAQIVNLDSLNYWGTGPNRTALIIQWNDSKSPTALAWGYKWSGSQTAGDMLTFLAANDPLLFMRIDSATSLGPAFFGFGYQTGSAPFGVTGAKDTDGNPVTPVFTAGVDDLNTNPYTTQAPTSSTAAAPLNLGDRYVEGWIDNGFWEMFHSGTSNTVLQASYAYPTTWTSSWVGAGVTLVNDSWVAYSFNPGVSIGVTNSLFVTAAIPEPSSFALIALGAGVFVWYRRTAVPS
jgi:hypothetical protein